MSLFILFLFGAIVGSFLNVLIDRLPRNESVIGGRSYCESCKRVLKWYDLIPLLSFIFLKARCRYCGSKISYYYPIVELTTGVLFALTLIFLPVSSIKYQVLSIIHTPEVLYSLFLVSSLIVIFFTDLKYGIIPDKVLFPAIIVSLVFLLITNHQSLITNILSALGAFLFFFILFAATKGKGMGFGDVKLAFLMGLVLGFPKIVSAFYIAFLTGAFISIILIVLKKKKLKGSTIPFGPFLVFGTIVIMFLGDLVVKTIIR